MAAKDFRLFIPPCNYKRVFSGLYAESLQGFREVAVPTNFFSFLYFWGQKYQKPPHVVFRGIARAAALHGARKIRPMRHPVADAPQLAPSFSASNESADLLCRQRRHYMACAPHSFYPQGDPRLGSDGGKADGRLKARAAGTVCLQTRAVARRRYQPFGRRHRNRSGGFCCFSPPKSREKSFFRRFFRKPKKDVERLFAAFRHRKAEKKGKSFQAFFCKKQKDIGRLLATYTRKNNQQRILPYRKAPIPSICRANSLRAVRS